ncbi:MAG: hypothetical protein R3E66_20485 [bacterium]
MKLWMPALVALLAVGCSDAAPTSSQSSVDLPAGFGKSDNYISTNAAEYMLDGEVLVALPADFAELDDVAQAERAQNVGDALVDTLSRKAKSRLEEILRTANTDITDEDAKFFIYVKPAYQKASASESVVDGDQIRVTFTLQLVGSADLLKAIEQVEGGSHLSVTYTQDGAEAQTQILVSPVPSTDAFPKYNEIFEDGVYDITVIFGGDYNQERYDLETAKWTVQFLRESGWQNDSVTTFEDLKYDSAPFVLPVRIEGKDVEARVHIIHSQMDDDAGQPQSLLRELVEAAVKRSDVVIYSGHAGAGAGMILDYQPRYELDDSEFDTVEMKEGYQIWVFDGCNSYRTYVEALMENPNRDYSNTNVVTTVNTTPFSAGYEIINRFVHWLVLTEGDGSHIPVSWNTLLRGVNDSFPDVHYGVHGIDDNPKINPNGSDALCQSCTDNADCGGGGNFCVNYGDTPACSVACTTDAACGPGYECIALFDDPDLFYMPMQCVRTSQTCE